MFSNVPPQCADDFNRCLQFLNGVYGGRIFAADNLITVMRNQTWGWDDKFMAAVKEFAETEDEKGIVWRTHGNAWAASHCLNVPGGFVECGVLRGLTASVLCRYLDFASVPKTFYLYDTFAGLPEETSTEHERAEHANYKSMTGLESFVRSRFADYPNVKVVAGVVPHTFDQECPVQISYLHVDMNSEQAERLTLERLFPLVSPGGIIVLDDFGWIHNRNQTVSQIKFFADRGHKILELPTGQGMVFKNG